MPNFPSLTPASTTNVDEGTDLISNARADIKNNFDNVNSIISTFDGKTIVVTDESQAFTKQQYLSLQTLSNTDDSAGGIAWDLSNNQVAQLTLGSASTLANPTNQQAGATYVLIVKQPAGANYTLAFDTAYKFAGGTAPTITATNGAVDILTFISDGTNMYGGFIQDFS
jgi:hypothetical protein